MRTSRTAGALAALCLVATLSGCTRSPTEIAHERLQLRLDGVHAVYLDQRARHPGTSGSDAVADLDPYDHALATTTSDEEVGLLVTIGATVVTTEWLEGQQVWTEGACVLVTVRTGDGDGDRGSVRTEPVTCPPDTDVAGDHGARADVLTTDLDAREDDVGEPPYDAPVCTSGGDCSRGGG